MMEIIFSMMKILPSREFKINMTHTKSVQDQIEDIIIKIKHKEELSQVDLDKIMDVLRAYNQVLYIASHHLLLKV